MLPGPAVGIDQFQAVFVCPVKVDAASCRIVV
jgi:hypothetical protein